MVGMCVRPLLLAILLLTLACTPGRPDAEAQSETEGQPELTVEPKYEPPPIGAYVVLREDVLAFTGPSHTAPTVALPVRRDPGYGRLVRVRAFSGEFIEVETLDPSMADGCIEPFALEYDDKVRVFVGVSGLLPVVARPKHIQFDDGTEIELTAGVPVLDAEPGVSKRKLQLGGATMLVPLAGEDLALWFEPPTSEPRERDEWDRGSTRTVWLRGEPLGYGNGRFRPLGFFDSGYGGEPVDGGVRMAFENPCGRFRFIAHDGEYEPFKPSGGLYSAENLRNAPFHGFRDPPDPPGDDVCESPGQDVFAGTQLSWRTGGPAGVIGRDHSLDGPLDGPTERHGDQICFMSSDLWLCVDATEVLPTGEFGCEDGLWPRKKPRPRVRLAQPKIGKGIDANEVATRVDECFMSVLSCYSRAVLDKPKLRGRVTITFLIGPDGEVDGTTMHDSTLPDGNDELEHCITAVVDHWESFPRPLDDGPPVEVRYTFVFSPG
jgi:hypothetical protein